MSMADDAVTGLVCSGCFGVFFRKAHGYPVLCKECWRSSTPEQKEVVQKTTEREL